MNRSGCQPMSRCGSTRPLLSSSPNVRLPIPNQTIRRNGRHDCSGSTAVEIGSDQLFPLWDLKADIACDEVIVRRSSQWHRPLCYIVADVGRADPLGRLIANSGNSTTSCTLRIRRSEGLGSDVVPTAVKRDYNSPELRGHLANGGRTRIQDRSFGRRF